MDKRLTIRHEEGSLPAPWDLNWEEAMERLAYYEDAEEEGRLIVLPKPPRELNLRRAAELILADEQGLVEIHGAESGGWCPHFHRNVHDRGDDSRCSLLNCEIKQEEAEP